MGTVDSKSNSSKLHENDATLSDLHLINAVMGELSGIPGGFKGCLVLISSSITSMSACLIMLISIGS